MVFSLSIWQRFKRFIISPLLNKVGKQTCSWWKCKLLQYVSDFLEGNVVILSKIKICIHFRNFNSRNLSWGNTRVSAPSYIFKYANFSIAYNWPSPSKKGTKTQKPHQEGIFWIIVPICPLIGDLSNELCRIHYRILNYAAILKNRSIGI